VNPAPGFLRVQALLVGLAARRWTNRLGSAFRRPPKEGEPRRGTPRKGVVGGIWTTLLLGLLLFQGASASFQLLGKFARRASERGGTQHILISPASMAALRLVATPGLPEEAGLQPLQDTLSASDGVPADRAEARARTLLQTYREKGEAAFETSGAGLLKPKAIWRTNPDGLTRALGATLLLVAFTQLVLAFGGANQDLGKVEWTLEWLFTLPASASSLFLAKTAEYALVNAYTWIMTLPLLGVFLYASGAGPWTVPLALAGTLASAFMVGAVRLLADTWLRMHFSLEKLKTLQAACTLLGTLLLMAVFGGAVSPAVPAGILDAFLDFPRAALWSPFALPAGLCSTPALAGSAMVAVALGLVAAALRLAQRIVRDGLLTATGVYQGVRGRGGPAARVQGILGKDLRVLLRDRNFLVQTLAVPLIIVGFQLFLNPALLRGIVSDFRHAAAAAYSVGAYVLLCSAFHVLTVEGGTLWLLFTLPVPLDRILRRKALLWSAFAAAYTVAILAAATAFAPPSDASALGEAVLAVVGVVIFAFTVAALGTLGTDPLQTEVQRRFRPDMAYLAMLLAGTFAWTIYSPSAWQKIVQTILSSLLALALWQKVRDRIPYLLDPTEAPPPRVTLSDGLIALLAFFVLQALLGLMFFTMQLEAGFALLLAYTIAGSLVSLFALFSFWRHKVPDLLRSTGLRPIRGTFLRSLAWGVGGAAAAAALAWTYLALLRRSDALRPILEEAEKTALSTADPTWVAILAIGAAPLVEEFLFRGLVLRGLRRSWGAAASILAGAALFAAVHPPAGFVPVFGLGLAASIAFERTGWLLAPVLCHALYNASVFFALPLLVK
jgi:ABC-2 type transport system permease protein